MNNIDTSNLIDQLIRMSDYSLCFQFILMNKEKILVTSIVTMFFLLLLTGEMMKNIIRKRFAIILFAILSLSAIASQTAFLVSLFATLTQEQIKTVKSIDSPEFQTIVQKSIMQNGATLDAINSAVKEFQEKDSRKKSQENKNFWSEMGKDGIELYNKTEVK